MKNILLVEDEVLIGLDLKMKLLSKGYNVCGQVDTGEEAIQQALQINPDLIICDIRLKGELSGIEAIKSLREQGFLGKVIFLSGYGDKKIREEASKVEPTAYLVKPVKYEDLFTEVKQALNL
ncbi:response regulator [Spirochaeta cellobiosiphila]|uniref:response regulator n=1 Tax=Spirochaeta cellobiosiphila TaxID=504483 RepID=UPI00041A228B|nr:response regulator [Spirochaeta cellobiosiphila]